MTVDFALMSDAELIDEARYRSTDPLAKELAERLDADLPTRLDEANTEIADLKDRIYELEDRICDLEAGDE